MDLNDFPISFWFELLCLIICVFKINKLKGSNLILLFPLLAIIVIGEFIGIQLGNKNLDNSWLYNLLTIIQFSFWLSIFHQNLKSQKLKKLTKFLFLFFIVFSTINILFFQGIFNFNNYTLIFGSFIIILLCCLMFYQILNDKSIMNPIKYSFFWINSGAFFFFVGTFFYFSLYNSLQKIQEENNTLIFNFIILNLNVVFYGLISIGLIVHKRTK